MSSNNHPIRDGIIIMVVGTVIIGVIALAWKFIYRLLVWLGSLMSDIWSFVLEIKISVSLWLLLLLGLLSLFTIYRFIRPVLRSKLNVISFLAYKQDVFFNVTWRWNYDYEDMIIISTISSFCPLCDTRLIYRKVGFSYEVKLHLFCETCQKELQAFNAGDIDDIQKMVARQIDRKIRNNEWKSLVAKNERRN